MNLFKTIIPIATVAAISIGAESCSTKTADDTIEFETRVDSVGFMTPDYFGDTVYTAAKYSVVWPEKIGQQDFDALRDSLLALTFGSNDYETFDAAAKAFMTAGINELKQDGDSLVTYTAVTYDAAYDAANRNFSTVQTDVTLLTPRILVIQAYNYQYYYGAAHGMNTMRYLNYSLVDHKLLDARSVFKPGNETAILDLINASAKEHYPEEGTLSPDPIAYFDEFQITENDIVFIYQPYDVAPYSTGVVRVPVSKFDLYRFFTPEAAAAMAEE
ncbi:MAG: RsiV family protein [Bacteroides sp.]|nr:RsiV family protein [Bacteroides sp.]MCM1379480.1 RsiV family protein [Bacteroides sp.]MCM1445917.1 RsiV family protein [Prevotella sp.]